MDQAPFTVIMPKPLRGGVILASPHSGRIYPDDLIGKSILDSHQLRSSEDAYVERLLVDGPQLGAMVICARYARAYLDLNRGLDELDPALIDGLRSAPPSPRVAAGLGIVPRVVAGGRAIYSGKISLAEADRRIQHIWHPYHQQLNSMMDTAHAQFGQAILLDMHSMPREALDHTMTPRPQIVIGDRFGAAAGSEITEIVHSAFAAQGFTVARNIPFAGAYIAKTYGQPSKARHVVQIEIDRSLYMNEALLEPSPEFPKIQRAVSAAWARIIAAIAQQTRLAAE